MFADYQLTQETMMNVKMGSYAILILLLVFQVASCDWAAGRRISLDFNHARSDSNTLSADVASNNMKKALEIIDEVMNKYRLTESELTSTQKENGGIRQYFKPSEKNRPPIDCTIYRRDDKGRNRLEVHIIEFLGVRLSDTAEAIIEDIQGGFVREFGKSSITIIKGWKDS